MPEFVLDTSGQVCRTEVRDYGTISRCTLWGDLTPFEQGYVTAMLEGIRYEKYSAGINKGDHVLKWDERVNYSNSRHLAFRDLAPETLAMVRRDCERFAAKLPDDFQYCGSFENPLGGAFWAERNGDSGHAGAYARLNWLDSVHMGELDAITDSFPPLTPYLGDDGKVYLS